jgi:hypothetical protein
MQEEGNKIRKKVTEELYVEASENSSVANDREDQMKGYSPKFNKRPSD